MASAIKGIGLILMPFIPQRIAQPHLLHRYHKGNYMKKVLLVVLLSCVCAMAADRVSLSWVPSITPSASGTNVYRASGACPATGIPTGGVKIGQVSGVTAGYDDLAGTEGQVYCYYGTAFRTQDGAESVASNTSQATFPFQVLAPPTTWKGIQK
jgi:hypothetical protein